MASSEVFVPEVIDAIARHMNGDHADDNVVICRGLTDLDDVSAATMTGMDPDGVVFEAITPAGAVTVHVPFSRPIEERADVRHEVVRMYGDACTALGIEPSH